MASVVVIFVILPVICYVTSNSLCPEECQCLEQADRHIAAKCFTKEPQLTVDRLPWRTSHLEIYFTPDITFYGYVFFGSLTELRFLSLETQEEFTSSHKIYTSNETFINNSKLEVFHSRVSLAYSSDFLESLSNLTEILLSNTKRGWNDFKQASNISLSDKTKLAKLYLKSLCEPGYSEWDVRGYFSIKGIFGDLGSSKIRELDISSNELHYIASDWFGGFRYLEYLDISYNMLCYRTHKSQNPIFAFIATMVLLQELKTLNVGFQGKYAPYKHRSTEGGQLLPTNAKPPDTFQQNGLGDFPVHNCSPFHVPISNVEYLNGQELIPDTYTPLNGATRNPISCLAFQKQNKLKYLDLKGNARFASIFAMGWKSVIFLNLDHLRTINVQDGAAYEFHIDFFNYFESLEVALIGGNNLGASLKQGQHYFANNSNLKVLDLASNLIERLPEDFFLALPMLTHVNLSQNILSEWSSNITVLSDLRWLNLSYNSFTNLTENFCTQLELLASREDAYGTNYFVVDLQNNPLSCLCQDIRTVDWIQTTNVFLHKKDTYTCIHPMYGQVNLMKVNRKELHDYCNPNKTRIIVISATASTLGTLLLVSLVMVYCKRWHLRYWWYLLHKGWSKYRSQTDENQYEYDVFVAHSTEDGDWVTGDLLHELEDKRGLRLCLYQRDIYPNEILVEAIVDRIDKSRHTLLIISPNFVASNWCHFEMHIAHAKLSEDGNDMIFPVIYKPISAYSINKTLHYLLKRKVYLEWPSDELGQRLFWDRLASALGAREVTGSNEDHSVMTNDEASAEETPLLGNSDRPRSATFGHCNY